MSRLEEIKARYVKYEYDFNLDREHIDWLINRVEELERELDKDANISFSLEGQLNDALDIVERYKQALEEIAQETGTPYADIAIKALEGEQCLKMR